MSNSRLEHKLDLIIAKLNYITNVLELSRQPSIPRSSHTNPYQAHTNPFPAHTNPYPEPPNNNNTTNYIDETIEFRFSAPTTNNPNILSSLLNINSLVPTNIGDIRLTHREITENTSILVATQEHTSEMCSISRENFNEWDIIRKINQCGHFFLCENLDNWLTTNNTCPLCRVNVVSGPELNTTTNNE